MKGTPIAGRTTVYNNITSDDKLKQVNPENIELMDDFIEYLTSIDRSKGTIAQYKANLKVFWCWNLEYNKNKFFVELTKREVAKFQNHALTEWGWSPSRIRTVKATLSSLSNYIENILDDEYQGYKPIINKIESPAHVAVREKIVFQADDLKPLLDYLVAKGEYMQACALSLAINSGRRKAEIPRFKASYFTKENTICNGALYKTPEKITTKGRGSMGKPLYLYTLAKPFQPYFDLWMKQRKELGIKSDWLFPKMVNGKYKDEPIGIDVMDNWAKKFSVILGSHFYWHSIRHYFTTNLKAYGIPDSVVQSIVGWESTDMVNLYDDTPREELFDKYFGEDGIRQVKKTSLEEL